MDKTAAEVLGQAMNRKPSNGKSVWCTMVLRLMDTEEYSNNYCRSLALVLELFPEVNRKELESIIVRFICISSVLWLFRMKKMNPTP